MPTEFSGTYLITPESMILPSTPCTSESSIKLEHMLLCLYSLLALMDNYFILIFRAVKVNAMITRSR